MIEKTQGIVHGKTIVLEVDLGLPDGERVEVTVGRAQPNGGAWGDGLWRCAGSLADSWTEEDDRILEQIYRERKADNRPEI